MEIFKILLSGMLSALLLLGAYTHMDIDPRHFPIWCSNLYLFRLLCLNFGRDYQDKTYCLFSNHETALIGEFDKFLLHCKIACLLNAYQRSLECDFSIFSHAQIKMYLFALYNHKSFF
jgi:hypothetical protein